MTLIFDSHLDIAWNALSWKRDVTQSIAEINRRETGIKDSPARGHAVTSLPEMRKGRVAVCLGTILARRAKPGFQSIRDLGDLDYCTAEMAHAAGRGQLAYYRILESVGEIAIIEFAEDLRLHWEAWENPQADKLPIGVVLAMEGADPIGSPSNAESWWSRGVRSIGLAHYGESIFAVGTGSSGPLTRMGRELLREMEQLGLILDMTHLSDPSFYQALDRFTGPVMASHNNCRALVPSDRQFSDEQIRLLLERGAVIGVAMDAWMLHEGWVGGQTPREAVSLSDVADHIDHICQLAGNERHVAIGSDLDGGFGSEQAPREINGIADVQQLRVPLEKRGYTAEQINRIFHGNWLRFFGEHLPRRETQGCDRP